jgi:hypothetical protein
MAADGMQAKVTLEIVLAELRELRALLDPVARALPEHPMTPEEFATVTGKSAKTVRRWIIAGRLRARQDCRPWLITPVNARKFLDAGGAA